MPRTLLLTWLLCGPLVPVGLARADGMRCGTALVRDGQRTSEVLAACGEPTHKVQRVAPKTGLVTDIWTYDLGPREFIRHLRFQDDVLVDISLGGYGTGRR